jgi:hypothetical protein
MRAAIALTVMVISCGSTQAVGISAPRPIHNSKCGEDELRERRPFQPAVAGGRFWLNLQTGFDLENQADRLGAKLTRDVEILRRAG